MRLHVCVPGRVRGFYAFAMGKEVLVCLLVVHDKAGVKMNHACVFLLGGLRILLRGQRILFRGLVEILFRGIVEILFRGLVFVLVKVLVQRGRYLSRTW